MKQKNQKTKLLVMFFFLSMVTFINMEAQVKTEVTADSVVNLISTQTDWIVLDVRTPEEFKEWHIPGAINIDVRPEGALKNFDKLDKNAKYIVYCRTKNRSGLATDYMVKNGFKTVYIMIDGIGGWKALFKNNPA